jgi:hypothetical protein
MSALPEGTYQGIVLSSKPSPKHKIHVVTIRLLNGEQIEAVIYGGRGCAVMLAQAALKFSEAGQPWLPNPDRTVPLPVLKIELDFDQRWPDRNRILSVSRTGDTVLCDVRDVLPRTDFAAF